jgi:hypothetical protein
MEKNKQILFQTKIIKTKYSELHHVDINDAQLIFDLRTKRKENYLKKTKGNVQDQKKYIKKYLLKFRQKKEIYYKIFDPKINKFAGVLRLTNLEMEKKFSWESYVVSEDCTPITTLDAMLTIYSLGFEYLNSDICGPWAVDRENKRVSKLHDNIGMAKIVNEDEKYAYYSIIKNDYEARINYFMKMNLGQYKI